MRPVEAMRCVTGRPTRDAAAHPKSQPVCYSYHVVHIVTVMSFSASTSSHIGQSRVRGTGQSNALFTPVAAQPPRASCLPILLLHVIGRDGEAALELTVRPPGPKGAVFLSGHAQFCPLTDVHDGFYMPQRCLPAGIIQPNFPNASGKKMLTSWSSWSSLPRKLALPCDSVGDFGPLLSSVCLGTPTPGATEGGGALFFFLDVSHPLPAR